jgi:hypothetical protein
MSKKLQLKIMVFLCMIIVIFVYFYISKDFSFRVMEDLGNLRDSVEVDIDDLSGSEFIENVKEKFDYVKEEIEKSEEGTIESTISEKVLEKLSHQDTIVYEHEPWSIKFSYDSLMTKEIDQDNEKILLSYDDVQDVYLTIRKIILEEDFNDWLNNNYDLQSLNKYEHNDSVFWLQDFSDDENRIEEYYFSRGEKVFIFSLNSPKEKEDIYWSILESIIKSFDLIEDINL